MRASSSIQEQQQRMSQAPVPSLVCSIALPSIAGQLITVIYNTADTYFVSHLSTSASAAVGIVFSLMSLIQAVGFSIGTGSNNIICRRLGAGAHEEAFAFASSALFLSICLGS